jgi:hypothetical protein
MSNLPDVFAIGAMKAGTSTLWKDVFRTETISPSKSKEVNFFLHEHSVDTLEKLYARQFDGQEKIKIDVSPNYSRQHIFPGVAKRIYTANPKAKILYLVRNPIDRIISHLHHDMFRDRITDKNLLQSLFAENSDYIKTSSYFYQIEAYLQHFDKQQILILDLEGLKKDPINFCHQLSLFLGVDKLLPPRKSYNISEKRYLIKFHDRFHQRVSNAFLGNLYHYIWYFINIKIPKPSISGENIEGLKKLLREDSHKLSSYFGVDISNWNL